MKTSAEKQCRKLSETKNRFDIMRIVRQLTKYRGIIMIFMRNILRLIKWAFTIPAVIAIFATMLYLWYIWGKDGQTFCEFIEITFRLDADQC